LDLTFSTVENKFVILFLNILLNTKKTKIMNYKQENKLSMFDVLIAICLLDMDIIDTVPALKEAYTEFKHIWDQILHTTPAQALRTDGVAMDKNEYKDLLCTRAGRLARVMRAFAYRANDNTMRSNVNYTPAVLGRMRDEDLRPIVDIITEHATTHLAALGSYGITADTLAQLADTYGKYKQFVPKPTVAVVNRKDAGAELESLINQANDILRFSMDDIVQILEESEPRFFRRYNSARNIYDLRGSRPANFGTLKGLVKDAATGLIVPGVLIEIEGSQLIDTTDINGEYSIDIAPGTYSIRASQVDYTEFEQDDVVVVKGEDTTVDISLELMV
jgi:hypothetical protein